MWNVLENIGYFEIPLDVGYYQYCVVERIIKFVQKAACFLLRCISGIYCITKSIESVSDKIVCIRRINCTLLKGNGTIYRVYYLVFSYTLRPEEESLHHTQLVRVKT